MRQAERDDSTSAGNRLRSAVHVVALPRFAEAPLISEKGILRSRSAAVVEIYCFTSSIVKVTSNYYLLSFPKLAITTKEYTHARKSSSRVGWPEKTTHVASGASSVSVEEKIR